MSLEWGVYRQKPYGWQVRRQRKAAWAALEMDSLPPGVRHDSLSWMRGVAPPCFRPLQDLACLLK